MTDVMNEIAAFDGRMAKVVGPVRSGKTEALVRRAAACVAAGTAPEDILLAVSTAEAARRARLRAVRALEAAGVAEPQATAARLTVATAQNACLTVLATPEAQAATGRTARVLAPFEYNFFLEDMKTLGQPVRRLRSVLNRFQQQWSALAPEADWVVPGDEEQALNLAHQLLDASGAVLEAEVAFVCGQYLQSEAGAQARQRFAVVLADDFQNLSIAQQTCLCLLARDQVIVAGNPNETLSVATRFPAPEGFTTFDTLRRDVTVFTLEEAFGNPNITAFCDALCAAEGTDDTVTADERTGAIRDIATVKWNTPDEEFNGLTRYLFAQAQDDANAVRDTTCLVAPNKQWAQAFAQMLERRGFSVSCLGFERLGGDPRSFDRARAMMAYTALNLVACPEDVAAWRAWVGFGNYLTMSDGWRALLDWCEEHSATPLEALAEASRALAAGEDEPFARGTKLAERYNEGRQLIEQNAGRKGHSLLKAVGAEGLREYAALAQQLVGDEDAVALFTLVRAGQFDPTHSDSARAVHISSYEQMCGCSYEAVYAVGCVDGLMPARDAFEVVSTDEDRARVMGTGRRAFMSAAGKAASTLMFSTFSKADLELAERTKMQVQRVRMEDGCRMATLRPTCFIEEAGACAPITLGGQAVLADLGID